MIKEIELKELQGLLDQGALLVDVREHEEVEQGAIDGMVHMPLSEFDAYKNKIPQDKATIFYCRSGKRSMTAAHLAADWTSQALYSLKGGYLGYIGET